MSALEGVRLQLLIGVEDERVQLLEIVRIRQLGLGAAPELRAAGEDRPGQDLTQRERRQQLVDLVQCPRAGTEVLARRLHAHDDDQLLRIRQDLLDLVVLAGVVEHLDVGPAGGRVDRDLRDRLDVPDQPDVVDGQVGRLLLVQTGGVAGPDPDKRRDAQPRRLVGITIQDRPCHLLFTISIYYFLHDRCLLFRPANQQIVNRQNCKSRGESVMMPQTPFTSVSLSLASFLVLTSGLFDSVACSAAESITIVEPPKAALPERLAAREIRRYLYLRTGELVPIVAADSERPVGPEHHHRAQGPADHQRHDQRRCAARRVCEIAATSAVSAEDHPSGQQRRQAGPAGRGRRSRSARSTAHIGSPSTGASASTSTAMWCPTGRSALTLPTLDERGEPLFQTRGIQPFHDFPEGPDWWNTDDYKAIIAQLPKLRMNFIGLHTYPQGGVGPEPTVWIGLKEDVNAGRHGPAQLAFELHEHAARQLGLRRQEDERFFLRDGPTVRARRLRPGGDVRGDACLQDARRKKRGLQPDGPDAQGSL